MRSGRRIVFLSGVMSFLILVDPLQAAETRPDLPAYAVGDAFIFSDGRVEQLRSSDGDMLSWSGGSGRPYLRGRNFIGPVLRWKVAEGEGRRKIVGQPDAIWPLSAGNSSHFTVISETRRAGQTRWARNLSLWRCRVGKPAVLDVPAGQFESWPIDCDRFSVGSMRLLERVHFDYAPDVGHFVRRRTIDYINARTVTIELAAALHGMSATTERIEALRKAARRK